MTVSRDGRRRAPYKFLDSYGPDDRDIFVARDREAETLVGDVVSSRLVVLFAKTGTGKTSLINAGVRPRLNDLDYATFYVRVERDPVAAVRGVQGQPSFSPDGKWIVYERDIAPGNNGVWLMRSNGTGLRRVTRNPFRGGDCGCDTDPNFSPDGKLISFVRIKKGDQQQALFVVRPNGTGLRQLTPYSWEVAIKHDWSPDGKLILLTTNADFVIPGASANLVAIKPNGTGKTELTKFTGGSKNAFAGSFSPDGKQIVFRLEDGDKYSLAVMEMGTHAITRLTTGPDKPRFIDWGTHQ